MNQTSNSLTRAGFLILFALGSGDKHGYALMREARELSDGEFQIGPATPSKRCGMALARWARRIVSCVVGTTLLTSTVVVAVTVAGRAHETSSKRVPK